MREKELTAQESAEHLVDALDQNTQALKSVRSRYRWSLVLSFLLAVSLGYTIYSNHESDVDACENGNNIRLDIDKKFDSIGDFLKGVIRDTPENQEFLDLVTSDLDARDCSNISWLVE